MNKPRILFFDIETSPILGYSFGIYETNIVHIVRDIHIMCFAYMWSDDKVLKVHALPEYKTYKKDKFNDKELLKDLHALIESADIVIGHNGDRFDIRIANSRFIQQGLKPLDKIDTEDTLKQARGRFKFTSNKLTDLARYAGLGQKIDTGGIKLWIDCENGDLKQWSRMSKYCKHDVKLLHGVWEWLHLWVQHKYNMNTHNDTSYSCSNCGSSKVSKNGTRITMSGKYQKFQCNDCGRTMRGTTNLLNNKPKIK